MKQSEIAPKVFELLEQTPVTDLVGGPLVVPVSNLAGLSLLPWFCEGCIQWAIRITHPSQPFRKLPFKKIKTTHAALTPDQSLLIGIPGDGIEPSIWALFPLADAIASIAAPGMILELAAANLGRVKRDWEVKAETITRDGDHRYVGVVDEQGRWRIEKATPSLKRAELETALACGRMVVQKGPWTTASKDEAIAILVHWFVSPEANLNPLAAKYFFRFVDGAFVNTDSKMDNKLSGLGLGFFRERLKASSFHWTLGPLQGPHTMADLEKIAREIVG